jgi:hypothetical protein
MTSLINPNNIDGTYPVAGQDNNSQGFRDNFTNTKTNFQYASNEITDLQNKAVLKSALTGTTLNNDMLGSLLSNATIQDFAATRLALGTLSGSVVINYAAGHVQTVTTGASISLDFTTQNTWPPAGQYGVVVVQVTVTNVSYTLTLPSSVSVNAVGIQGLNPSTNVITFATPGVYSFQFSTSDGGTTITVNEVNKALEPFNNSSENLSASAAASLGVTTSYFTTAATGETGTLAAGVAGQVKVLAYFAEAGSANTRILTVSNAGWKSSGTGTITFTEFGQTVTLMYINSKWFVIAVGPGASDTFATLA